MNRPPEISLFLFCVRTFRNSQNLIEEFKAIRLSVQRHRGLAFLDWLWVCCFVVYFPSTYKRQKKGKSIILPNISVFVCRVGSQANLRISPEVRYGNNLVNNAVPMLFTSYCLVFSNTRLLGMKKDLRLTYEGSQLL